AARSRPEQHALAEVVGALDGAPAAMPAHPVVLVVDPDLQAGGGRRLDCAAIPVQVLLREVVIAVHGQPRLDHHQLDPGVGHLAHLALCLGAFRRLAPEPVHSGSTLSLVAPIWLSLLLTHPRGIDSTTARMGTSSALALRIEIASGPIAPVYAARRAGIAPVHAARRAGIGLCLLWIEVSRLPEVIADPRRI